MGRPKGSANRQTIDLEDKAKSLGVDPFEILLLFAKRDWSALGYEEEFEERLTKDGGVFYVPHISADLQMNAAKEASKYLYSQKRAVELSNSEDTGFKVIIEDYQGKK